VKKVAFLTTIYPIDIRYVDDFLNSLNNQTNRLFDLIIANDGFCGIENFKQKYRGLNIIEIEADYCIAKNRELLITYAIQNKYEMVIFGDIDDYFEPNRVEVSRTLLATNDIVVNDLTAFRNDTTLSDKRLSSRVNNLAEVSLEFVLDKNIFGLSNTAIRLEGLRCEDIVFCKELVAVDWYFFSTLLLLGKKAIFTNDTVTYYRQHNANTVGIGNVDEQSVLKTLSVKLIHYEHMREKSDQFDELFRRTQTLSHWLRSKSKLGEFVRKNGELLDSPLWWETIELGEYQ